MRRTLLTSLLLPLCTLFGPNAAAQTAPASAAWPQRPITLLVAWSPGGAVDLLARQLGTVLSKDLGQSIVVENKAGANGAIGHGQAARSAADGYTAILATNSTFVIGPHLYKKLPYQHEKDLAPVSLIAASPLVLAVNPALCTTTMGMGSGSDPNPELVRIRSRDFRLIEVGNLAVGQVLFEGAVLSLPGLRAIPIAPPVTRTAALLWPRERYRSEAAREFVATVRANLSVASFPGNPKPAASRPGRRRPAPGRG